MDCDWILLDDDHSDDDDNDGDGGDHGGAPERNPKRLKAPFCAVRALGCEGSDGGSGRCMTCDTSQQEEGACCAPTCMCLPCLM